MEFKKAKDKAEEIVHNNEALRKILQDVIRKIEDIGYRSESIREMLDTLQTFVRMLKAYLQGEYQKIPWKTLTMVTAGLLYFLMPFDVIPDFIPVLGFMDDITVLLWIYKSFHDDIDEYRIWARENDVPS